MNLKIEEFNELILLKNNEYVAYTLFMQKYFSSDKYDVTDMREKSYNTEEGKLYISEAEKLTSYIESLDYESILDLGALILLGRDWSNYQTVYLPSSAYKIIREYMVSTFGVDKKLVADYISSRTPVNDYLSIALEILHPFD